MKKRSYKQSDINKNRFPKNHFKIKECKWCKKEYSPLAPSHLFCSDNCKDSHYTNSYFLKKYGITFKEVNELLEKQNHSCAICKQDGFKMHPNSWHNLVVDHDHKTGEVRGMLCHNCNRALGLLQDDINIIQNSLDYLKGATTILKKSTLK